jgi:hypothetical protein
VKTFFAILAAGAIIFAAFLGWERPDRWEQAKAYWTAQFRQANDSMPRDIASDIMVNLSVDDLTDAINRLDQSSPARTHASYELRLYLENKPFGFPLTDEENRLLKITGGGQTENRKARAQSESTPTPTPTPDTPTATPTDTPTPTPTDTPSPTPTPRRHRPHQTRADQNPLRRHLP